MTDNRTSELREKLNSLGIEHFDYDKGGRTQTQWEAPDGKRHFTYETSDNPAKTARLIIAWHPTPEQAIAATLGSDASAVRLAERLRSIADEMRSVGASSMSPHELLACYAHEVDKVADSLMFAAKLVSAGMGDEVER